MITVQSILLDAVEARLRSLKTLNGYFFDIKKIRRATLTPFNDEDLPAANYWPGADVQLAKGAGWVERELTVAIEYYTRARERPFTDVAFELSTDISVAMLRAPSAPLVTDAPEITLGGLVRSTQLQSITPQIGEGQAPWCGAALSYILSYRVVSNDPSTLITQ